MEVTVRASSMASLLDCAHRWEAEHILGMRKASSGAAHLGTSIHHGAELFDARRLAGEPVEAGEAVAAAVHMIQHPEQDVDFRDLGTMSRADMGKVAGRLLLRYCGEVAPAMTYVAVERVLQPLTLDVDGVELTLTGRMDRARVRDGIRGKAVVDLKTGRAAAGYEAGQPVAATKGHAPQLGIYELLEHHTTGEPCTAPAGIVGMKTSAKDPVIAYGEIPGAKDQLLGTDEEPGLLQMVAQFFRSGLFPPNPKSQLCSENYCARWHKCKFKG